MVDVERRVVSDQRVVPDGGTCRLGGALLGDLVEDLPLPLRRDSPADAVPAAEPTSKVLSPATALIRISVCAALML